MDVDAAYAFNSSDAAPLHEWECSRDTVRSAATFQHFEISTPVPSRRCSLTSRTDSLDRVCAERDALASELHSQRKVFMRELAAARPLDTTPVDATAAPKIKAPVASPSPVATRHQALEEQSHLGASPPSKFWDRLEEAERTRAQDLDELTREVRVK